MSGAVPWRGKPMKPWAASRRTGGSVHATTRPFAAECKVNSKIVWITCRSGSDPNAANLRSFEERNRGQRGWARIKTSVSVPICAI